MLTLFPVEPEYPGGFQYFREFISAEEENHLVSIVQQIALHNLTFKGYTATRKVASFGFDYSFDNGLLTRGKPIPPEFDFLLNRVSAKIGIAKSEIGELLVTEYPAGSVINWHRDAPPFDIIAGISILTDCTFKLRPQEKEKQTRSSIISIPVQRRSLYIMAGESRTAWQHSIAPVKNLRYSITLRTLKK